MAVVYYVEQHESFGLGNFINCTPTIRALAQRDGRPVNVLFRSEYVRECFLDSPFIRIVDDPIGKRLFGSDLICRDNSMPDWEFVYRNIIGKGDIPKGFIDTPDTLVIRNRPYICLANGAATSRPSYVQKKDPGSEPFKAVIDWCARNGYDSVFIGSDADYERNPWTTNCDAIHVGDIRECLSLLAGAEFFVSNDTGLYHAAPLLGVEQVVLWVNTQEIKNKNTGHDTCWYLYADHAMGVEVLLDVRFGKEWS